MINIEDFYNEFLMLQEQVHELWNENARLREQIIELNKDLCKVEAEVFDEDEGGYTEEERLYPSTNFQKELMDYMSEHDRAYYALLNDTYAPVKTVSLNELKEMYPQSCNHSWKTYVGLIEKYDYCEHCDTKRGL